VNSFTLGRRPRQACHFPRGRKPVILPQVPVISIIDDDASVRIATNRLVRSLGYAAITFASADDFLSSPHVDETSCIIADVQMPGISGIELQSQLIARGCPAPIIFITAFPEESIRVKALEGGAICFLSKPFDCSQLIKCIDIALRKRDSGAPK
jgi:FixJ family two-component response regulator